MTMTSDTFNDREKAFENKFKLDEELHFKTHVRAAKMLGQWAAGQLGLKGKEAESYAEKILESDVEQANPAGLLRKVQRDLQAKGVMQSEHQLQTQLNTFVEQAKKSLLQ
jgi:hypothetical protein